MHQRIIRIGLALLLFVVGIVPGFAAAVDCCCGPKAPEIKAKSCCPNCTCELTSSEEPKSAPHFVWSPVELETGMVPALPKQVVVAASVQSEVIETAPEPQSHSPPKRVLGRAPPSFCS